MDASRNDSNFHVYRTRQVSRLLADAATWDCLSGGVPLRSTHWLSPWWTQFGNDTDGYALVASDQQLDIRGIMPLYRRGRRGFRDLGFLGDSLACSDHVSLLCRPDDRQAVAVAMADFLIDSHADAEDGWDSIEIDGVLESDDAICRLAHRLESRNCMVQARCSMHCWYSRRQANWEAQLKTMGKTQRRRVRRLCERIGGPEQIVKRLPANEDEMTRTLRGLIQLHQTRWNADGHSGSFTDPRMVDFIHEAARRFFHAGRLYLPTLWQDRRMISGELHFLADDGRLFFYSSGYALEAAELQPGRILMADTLAEMHRRGWTGIDYLRGDEVYKRRMGARPERMLSLRIFSPTPSSRVRGGTSTVRFNAKQWLRQRLGRSAVLDVPLDAIPLPPEPGVTT